MALWPSGKVMYYTSSHAGVVFHRMPTVHWRSGVRIALGSFFLVSLCQLQYRCLVATLLCLLLTD
ncbi:hypothetical protein E4T42_01799 [Aureobasidium subglaciale]|nr:hypothetical protein E4T42_01799 [Aureobasidium subglaciale]